MNIEDFKMTKAQIRVADNARISSLHDGLTVYADGGAHVFDYVQYCYDDSNKSDAYVLTHSVADTEYTVGFFNSSDYEALAEVEYIERARYKFDTLVEALQALSVLIAKYTHDQ